MFSSRSPFPKHSNEDVLFSFPCLVFASSQPKLYKSVIEDVINEVRELFLDEGVDEQVLLELKTVTVTSIYVPVYICYRRKYHLWGSVVRLASLQRRN